ncbi:hypothetical protein Rhe02_52170 [Rhizocola hellebori]|uniref:HIRAN domain-containing protein n=1 Tax=Rhizocola hellebori TaxID=1392758 RepID=A0A8J3VI27_9ACTN|nr:HIRAN domain-containing protein [Rhizocola hellebori]GIH07150.1 hypothetical protein Rhe02_52170 [Rhizocola hellebori]
MIPDIAWTRLPTINLGTWQAIVHGENNYRENLEHLAGGRNGLGTRRRLFTATLVREPDNPYDSNAVQVRAGEHTIGYIARQEAARYGRLVTRIEAGGMAATCRAQLTGGWDRGGDDRGNIGVELCTGSSPTVWNGKIPFLARLPFHDDVPLLPQAGLSDEQIPAHKALVTLAPVGDALAVRHGDTWLGHIVKRPDLVRLIHRLTAAGAPATAEFRHGIDKWVIPIADCDTLAEAVLRPGRWIAQRCPQGQHPPPAAGRAPGVGCCGPTSGSHQNTGTTAISTTASHHTCAPNADHTH